MDLVFFRKKKTIENLNTGEQQYRVFKYGARGKLQNLHVRYRGILFRNFTIPYYCTLHGINNII